MTDPYTDHVPYKSPAESNKEQSRTFAELQKAAEIRAGKPVKVEFPSDAFVDAPDEPASPALTPDNAPPPGTLDALLAVERSQVGYNGAGTEDNPQTKYGAWNGYNGPGDQNAQWCLMFQNWCFAQAGIPIIPQPGWAGLGRGALGVVDGYNAYKSAGQFRQTSANPQPGDLCFFQYPGNGVPDHVGMVESYDPNTGLITSIQGNTTDAGIGRTGNCCRRKVHNRSYIVGFGVPTFGAVVAPDPLEEIMAFYGSKQEFEQAVTNIAAQATHATLKSDSVVGAAAYGPNFTNNVVAAVANALSGMNPPPAPNPAPAPDPTPTPVPDPTPPPVPNPTPTPVPDPTPTPTPGPSVPATQADILALQNYVKDSIEAAVNVVTAHLDQVTYTGLARADFNGVHAPDHETASLLGLNAKLDTVIANQNKTTGA